MIELLIKAPGFQNRFVFRVGQARAFVNQLLRVNAFCRRIVDIEFRQFVFGQVFRVAAEQNVGAAAGHVCGDRDSAFFTGLRDNLRFFFMLLGVQNRMTNAAALEHTGQQLALFNGNGADKNRLPFFVTGDDLLDDRAELSGFGLVHRVVVIDADHGQVRRNLDDVQRINVLEFFFFRFRRTGHARQLGIHTEIILEGDGGQRFVFALHFDVFLGFNGLMQPF